MLLLDAVKIVAYVALGFVVWYVYFALLMSLNSGRLGRGKWWVFECFWEQCQWFLPGGLAKRVKNIRERVPLYPGVLGWIGRYNYQDIREQNLYEQVAHEVLGSGYVFWGVNVVLMGVLWPIGLSGLILSMLLIPLYQDVRGAWERQ